MALGIYIDTYKPDGFDWSLAFDLVSSLSKNKNLTSQEITFGKKCWTMFKKILILLTK